MNHFTNPVSPSDPHCLSFGNGMSDLISNATRGCLAEFIVAHALGLADKTRDEWCPFDLETNSNIKVEVKSASYLQSWFHKEHSKILFSIRPSRAWSADTNVMATELKRQADVYVFCLLNHKEKDEQFDPMNLDVWDFYVVSAGVLDERFPTPKQIRLRSRWSIFPAKPIVRTSSMST